MSEGYASGLSQSEVAQVGADPFPVAHALKAPGRRTVVTRERSKPSLQRANRRIPDVCDDLDVPRCGTFQRIESLDFRTGGA